MQESEEKGSSEKTLCLGTGAAQLPLSLSTHSIGAPSRAWAHVFVSDGFRFEAGWAPWESDLTLHLHLLTQKY